MIEKTKILITGALHPTAVEAFRNQEHFDINYLPDLARDQLMEKIGEAHVLVTRSETNIDRQVIEKGTNLKVIGRAAVGVGNIDIPFATEKGILVINTPGKNTNSAAEMTMALLLSMFRKVPDAHQKVKSGGWDRHQFTGRELRHKRIGLVGIGHVGHRVAKFCRGFDMEVFGYDPYVGPGVFTRNNVTRVDSLMELAEKVDVLSVHVPLNKETNGMVDLDVLSRMKKGSWVVNAARGGVICETSILEMLEKGHIAGAAIDTWDNEPHPNEKLVKAEGVYVAPHVGASTEEAQRAIGETIVAQIIKAVEGGVVDYPVNLPQIGVVDNPLMKPYTVLAEKLGSFAAQVLEFNPTEVEISYRGDLAGDQDYSLIKLGFEKGYAAVAVDTYVSYVNAQRHFDALGIQIIEAQDPDFSGYRSAIKMKISGQKGETLTVGGIVFDHEYPRISLVNDFYFEVDPNGNYIIMENEDKPGVIGAVGTLLASAEINIDSFDLARNKKGGRAMAMIKIDGELLIETKRKLSGLNHVVKSHFVRL